MPKIKPQLIFFLTTLLLTGLGQASTNTASIAKNYEVFFRDYIEQENYPGAAFAIVSREKMIYIATLGHTTAARKSAINRDTVFRLASVSKPFAAELVGMLVEDGKLDWNESVNHYLPEFKIAGDTSQIKLHNILGQSTGIIPYAYDNLLEANISMDKIWRRMADLPFVCKPGSCYAYQNSLYTLVDPIVSRSMATSYPSLIEQRIFKPLGMKTASLGYKAFINNPNRAKPHIRSRGNWKTVAVKQNYYNAAPAAGVNASIMDMARWLQAQLGSNPDVISSELIKKVSQPRVVTRRDKYRKEWESILKQSHYGLGWRVYDLGSETLVYHGGWVSGFRADIAFAPDRNIGIVVLLNAESSGISKLTTQFWKMLFKV